MRSRRLDLSVTFVCLALLGYFAWHASNGPRGFVYRDTLDLRAASLQTEFAGVQRDRVRLEHKVGLLRPDSIDPDLLDELARSQLELAAPNELVVLPKQ